MIHTVRKLARAIHRRSVWQVLGVYVAIAWVALEVTRGVTDAAGLPEWTPALALVLLLIGLPVIVATTVVQGGIPVLRIEDAGDPNELVGLTPEQVHVIPEEHPLHGIGILTWRNAILGGVMALALLVTSVVAYMTMWALGIGPVGSLVAQGVIGELDQIIVAEFETRNGDPSLGAAMTDALSVDLAESTLVQLVDPRRVTESLASMGRDGTVLTPAVAREIAGREGLKVVIEGDISREGVGYELSAAIVLPNGTLIGRFREDANGDEDLIAGIDALSERLREKMGESLRQIREGADLAVVMTTSLDALMLYSEATDAVASGDFALAAARLDRAVQIDPDFVMAWRLLTSAQRAMGIGPGAD